MSTPDPINSPVKIAVLYLARKKEGVRALENFIKSYIAHPAGVDHDLIIIFKGYANDQEIEQVRAIFAHVPHISFNVPDEGFDLGSYVKVAMHLTHDYLCCFNTFSVILSDHWLKKLYTHASLPHVGIVGATGSYEGLSQSIALLQKATWLYSRKKLNKTSKQLLYRYFSFTLRKKNRRTSRFVKIRNTITGPIKQVARYLVSFPRKPLQSFEMQYQKWWRATKDLPSLVEFMQCPSFPNPHIRSNAFMVQRLRFLSFKKNKFHEKGDCFLFESGYESMTQQVLQAGDKALIVGHDGLGYEVDQWPQSKTFRLCNQENLLVADNQTRFFATATPEIRMTHTLMTWGEDAKTSATVFPSLGLKFQVTPSALGHVKM